MQPQSPRDEVSGNAKDLRARQPPRRDPETEGPSNPSLARAFNHLGAGSGELRPAHLPALRSRQRSHDPEVPRSLEPGEVVAAVLAELLEGRWVLWVDRDDPCGDVLAPLGVRPPRDHDVSDGRVRPEDRLDLVGPDRLGPGPDRVV